MDCICVCLAQIVPSLDVLKGFRACLLKRRKMVICFPVCSTDVSYTYSYDKVHSPCTAQHCTCETVVGGSAIVSVAVAVAVEPYVYA